MIENGNNQVGESVTTNQLGLLNVGEYFYKFNFTAISNNIKIVNNDVNNSNYNDVIKAVTKFTLFGGMFICQCRTQVYTINLRQK